MNINQGLNRSPSCFVVCLVGMLIWVLHVIQCGVNFWIFTIFNLTEYMLKIGIFA